MKKIIYVTILLTLTLLLTGCFTNNSLLVAIETKDYEEVRKILNNNPQKINQLQKYNYFFTETYPLFYAIDYSDLKMVKLLIEEYNANIYITTTNPTTKEADCVLVKSFQAHLNPNQVEIIWYFIDLGIPFTNGHDFLRDCALQIEGDDCIHLVKYFIENGHPINEKFLNYSVYYENFALTEYIIETPSIYQQTLGINEAFLYYFKSNYLNFTEYGYSRKYLSNLDEDFIRYLLDQGADLDYKDDLDWSAYQYGIGLEYEPITIIFEEYYSKKR